MSYSRWLKTDLHIHSERSNQTKDNDYDGDALTIDKLVSALTKDNVNLFSITDHNIINLELYRELISRKDELIDNELNFVIGVEIDFLDLDIHSEVFHMLVFFNSYDLEKISKILSIIFEKSTINEIDKNVKPIKLSNFFKATFDNGIKEVITIPHFNNKHKGIPSNDQIDKFAYTVFSALEDSNNRDNLTKSLNLYKKHNYVDVPIVVFSDNHNIDKYPDGKNNELSKQTSMHILGNIKYPFNSIKTAFQDVSTRISIENLVNRNNKNNLKYIEYLNIDGEILEMSNYQNTIIGGFGTGKSFLLDLILKGKSGVNQIKYKKLADSYNDFEIRFSDGTIRNSLEEVSDLVKIIKFNQYKDIYFKDILLESDKDLLEKNLHIKFPTLSKISNEKQTEIVKVVESLKMNFNDTKIITDVINYEAINRQNEKLFSFHIEDSSAFYTEPEYLSDIIKNLQIESNRKILKSEIYTQFEKNLLISSKNTIDSKNIYYISFSKYLNRIIGVLGNKVESINKESEENSQNITSNIKILKNIKNDLISFAELLYKVKNVANEFEEKFSLKKFEELKNTFCESEIYSYNLKASYLLKSEYSEIQNFIFKPTHRKTNMYKSIISTLLNVETFAQSQTFSERVDKYVSDFYNNYQEVCYDIIDERGSIMKKSAGEKANIIIGIIFNLIEDYSRNGTPCVVILDQPEDNLDNKGIHSGVVEKIRNLKINNILPQLICVSHNANISITADSENIILANKHDSKCSYFSSGIEDSDFINEVCNTLEGGTDALKKRSSKFNIPIIKELERSL